LTTTKADHPPDPRRPAATGASELDEILAIQFLVAWAGEGSRSRPRRFNWWDTDLVDPDGGGDLIARLAPRTHAWASLEAVREAARRADAESRERHGEPDVLRTIFFLGFELDEKVGDRLAVHKRAGGLPSKALPLPSAFVLGADFPSDSVIAALAPAGPPSFEVVPPIGRQLHGTTPATIAEQMRALAAALVPPTPEYPMPFFRLAR